MYYIRNFLCYVIFNMLYKFWHVFFIYIILTYYIFMSCLYYFLCRIIFYHILIIFLCLVIMFSFTKFMFKYWIWIFHFSKYQKFSHLYNFLYIYKWHNYKNWVVHQIIKLFQIMLAFELHDHACNELNGFLYLLVNINFNQ